MKKNDWKKRDGVVYSTSSNFNFDYSELASSDTLSPNKQSLYVSLDKSGRAGKQVTLISGFIGKADDLEILGKLLKTKCGVGGSCKDNNILIQGDVRDKVIGILAKEGYRAKRSGG